MIYLADPDVTLYHGDAFEVLRTLPSESVHCCVTSPPFYGLRDYGTGRWEAPSLSERGQVIQSPEDRGLGKPTPLSESDWTRCDHETVAARNGRGGSGSPGKNTEGAFPSEYPAPKCGKCGARRVDEQIGLEQTPELWVKRLVEVFREVGRVLRRDGQLWLEVGDSYATSGTRQGNVGESLGRSRDDGHRQYGQQRPRGLKEKDLIGAPWLLAFALRADGWYLRSDIVWARPNPMPESVSDRPTKSHSYVFLLTRSPRYYFDQEAVREPQSEGTLERFGDGRAPRKMGKKADGFRERTEFAHGSPNGVVGGRNIRSVWTIPTQAFPEAHFATFPEELARRCIAAGTSERGCCPECGAPWVRKVDVSHTEAGRGNNNMAHKGSDPDALTGRPYETRMLKNVQTLGWRPSCGCFGGEGTEGGLPAGAAHVTLATEAAVVLDPFVGSGTVPYVARKLGRRAIGIDLNGDYLELAAERLAQQSLFAHEPVLEGEVGR